MAIVADEARNFEIVTTEFAYEQRKRALYLSINAVLADQSDIRLLDEVVQLQTVIREYLDHLPIEVLESPDHGKGLYVYPKESLHCTLFFEPALMVSASQQELEELVEDHPWRCIKAGELDPLIACPRWFYAHPNNDPSPTITFSLQLHFNSDEFNRIRNLFLDRMHSGDSNPSKVRKSALDRWVRATINIARFMGDRFELLPADQSFALRDLYAKLNRLADDFPAYHLDVLSLNKSNAWLSAPSSVVQLYRLGRPHGMR